MKPEDFEDLLWTLAAASDDPPREDDRDVTNSILRAYREGELSPEDRDRVDAALASDPALRARAIAQAGIGQAGPDPAIRERVLSANKPRGSVVDGSSRFPARRWWALAAILIGSLGLGWFLQMSPTSTPTLDPTTLAEFDLTLEGLAAIRSLPAPETHHVVQAHADTPIRLIVEPREPRADLEFALYRGRGDQIRRVPDRRVKRVVERGAAFFEVRAADLVGPDPGVHGFWLVIAPPGHLPADATTEGDLRIGDLSGEAPSQRIYRLEIELLPAARAPGGPGDE